jgi:hypothetical protein
MTDYDDLDLDALLANDIIDFNDFNDLEVPQNADNLTSADNVTNVFNVKRKKSPKKNPWSKQPNDDEPTYKTFFDRVALYLDDKEDIKFTSAVDKKMLYTTLQTLQCLSENTKLLELYQANQKIKVSNNVKLEENRYKAGAQKRMKKPITEESTGMTSETFNEIYDQTKSEVFPVYKLLHGDTTMYKKDDRFIRDAKEKTPALRHKSDNYIFSIYDDFVERKSEAVDMIESTQFQIGAEGKYVWENQRRRYHQFKPREARDKPKNDTVLDEEGTRYRNKVEDVFINMKTFIMGGDDDIWREWYTSHGRKDKYDALKGEWNDYVKQNAINIQFTSYTEHSIVINGTEISLFEKTLEEFAKMRHSDAIVKKVQMKLYDIYEKDCKIFKQYIFGNGTTYNVDYYFTRDLSRYEIMLSKKPEVEANLKNAGIKEDTIHRIMSKIDFLHYPKKANRSRSVRIVPKNRGVVSTPSGTPIETSDGIVKAKRKSPKKMK